MNIQRRKFLIKFGNLSVIVAAMLVTPSILKAEEFKKSDLSECTFHGVYPTSFWDKSYASWVITGIVIAGAIAFSYFTAGAGAPAASSGVVSYIASTIGGGGAGSYMAGLSMIGGAFGGNAMLGAAILNGIYIGTIGSGATLAGKLALALEMSLNGLYILKGENGEKIYKTEIFIPSDIGDDKVQEVVEKIYDIREDIKDAQEDNNSEKIKELFKSLNEQFELANYYLKLETQYPPYNIDNILVLSILAYNSGNIKGFLKGMEIIENYDYEIGWKENTIKKKVKQFLLAIFVPINSFYEKESYSSNKNLDNFILYLKAIKELVNGKKDTAISNLLSCYYNEKYVMESAQMLISLYSETRKDFESNLYYIRSLIELVDENFDPDKYYTDKRSKMPFFMDMGLKFYRYGYYKEAIEYFDKAYDELSLVIKYTPFFKDVKNQINIYKALCYLRLGNYEKAKNIYNEVLENSDDDKKQEYIKIFESEKENI